MSQLQVTGEAKIRDIQGPVVANSGVITALDGAASQYVRGDGTLADFPTSSGGGSSVSYYLNSSVSQGTIGGVAYRELSKEPIIGAGTDIAIAANGYVASYLTDANDPDVLSIPGGNFNCEFYFSVNNNTGNPFFYAELYKYDGTTFTLLGSSVGVPEYINQGTIIAPYYFAIPVPTSALALTDRLAIRIYVNVDGRTVTLHTENSHLCQVVTTLSKGMVSLNNLTDQSQYLTTGTSGTDFNIVSSGDTHTFNIPSASASNRGLITTGSQTIAGAKVFDNPITANSGIGFLNGVMPNITSNLYTGIGGNSEGISIITRPVSTNYTNNLYFGLNNNSYTFPDATGTIALTSDLSSYVPYTGATGNVNLGTYGLKAGSITTEGGYNFKILASGTLFENGYSVLSSVAGNVSITQAISAGNLKTFTFDFSAWATNTSRTYTLPDITGTLALLEGTQTFSGAKTFANNVKIDNGVDGNYIGFKQYATGSTGTTGFTTLYSISTNGFGIGFGTTKAIQFDSASITTFRTYTFPDASGTVALTSDLSSYVPYTGATTNVSLGSANSLSAKEVSVYNGSGYNTIIGQTNGIAINFSTFSNRLYFESANNTFTFPNATGIVALTSNLSAYLPLTGGTLTGNLTIAKADTLNVLTLSSTNTNVISFITSSVQKGEISVNASNFQFNSATTNGYIFKNSAANNVLTITDAGVTTLTGALSGTSATFSSSVTAGSGIASGNSLILANGTNARQFQFGYSTGAGYNYFQVYDGSSFQPLNINNTMHITSAGNVGIGTSTVNAKLDVASTYVSDTATQVMFRDNTGGGLLFGGTGGAAKFLQAQDFTGAATYYNILLNPRGGNVGIGTSSPTQLLEVSSSSLPRIVITNTTNSANSGLYFNTKNSSGTVQSGGIYYIPGTTPYLALSGDNSGTHLNITSGGNVLIGTTTNSGFSTSNRIKGPSATEGTDIISIDGGVEFSGLFRAVSGANYSGAQTAIIIGRNTSTLRSINAGGTINASGADYAEYMTKAIDDIIEKGDIVGVDENGLLTNIFDDAKSFVVKSTNPSYVGGDTWGSVDIIGKLPTDATDEQKAKQEAKLEAARAKVDRIAFSGQVPCNVYDAQVGDYIIPIELDGKISGQAVSNPTFEQYQISVGKVWKIMEDGRAWIAVKIG